MPKWFLIILLLATGHWTLATFSYAGYDPSAIWNSAARVEILKAEKGAYGFSVSSGKKKVCDVELATGRRWVASDVKTGQDNGSSWVLFRSIDTSGTKGTPVFGDNSYVRVSLKDNNPFPVVEFLLDFRSFDPAAWKASLSPVSPVYYLRCTPPKSTMFYIGGGYIPSLHVETFPLQFNKGKMSGEWSDGWSYAPAMAGWAVPAVGLWDHEAGNFVAYDFSAARHTDKSDKYIASAYCYGIGDHAGEFFTLVHPYQTQWTKLAYPQTPSIAASSFEIIYSFDIPSWKDPNMFVMQRIYGEHRDILPDVSRMNDVGFIPLIDSWTSPYGLGPSTGSGAYIMGKSSGSGLEGAFMNVGTTVLGNRFIADGMGWVRFQKDRAAMRVLKDQLKVVTKKTVWMNINGDTCCSWKIPFEGPGFKDQWGGKNVETIYNECTFDIGTAMLFAYMDRGETVYLPYIDGVYNWAKHFLFQRNGVCDLSWAMFCHVALSGGENFMMNYRKFFRNDPVRGKNYDEALRLAQMCLYKTMWIYTTDPDETDLMDPSFLIQAVNSDWWIGKVTWNECGWIPRVMIPLYCDTGDPLLKYLLRGVLDRFWAGYKADAVHVVENIEIFGEKSPKGERSGSPFDGCMLSACRRWAYPVGDAVMRVDAGEKAAIAFCRDCRDYDIEDYACDNEMNLVFKVVRITPPGRSPPINIIVTAPFKDLRGKKVYVNGVELPEDRFENNIVTEGEDVYIKGVKPGDVISIGDVSAPILSGRDLDRSNRSGGKGQNVKTREATKDQYKEIMGFKCLNISQSCNSSLEMRWWKEEDPFSLREDSWFGYSAGEHIAHGMPFMLEDPVPNNGNVCADGPVSIPVGLKADAVALIFGSLTKESGPALKASIELEGGKVLAVNAVNAVPADITNGLPIRKWNLYLVWCDIGQPGTVVSKINVEKGRIFAVSLSEGGKYGIAASKKINGLVEKQALDMQNSEYYLPVSKSPVDWQWWDKSWHFRAFIEADAGSFDRDNAVVRLKEDFGMLFSQAGLKEELDPSSIRVVEYSQEGKPLKEVPAQFDPVQGSKGELIYIMTGKTPANQKRFFYLYLDSKKNAKKNQKPLISLVLSDGDKAIVNTGKGGVELEFLLDGNGIGPRVTNITFDKEGTGDFSGQQNVLGRSGYNSGYLDLTACQDPICWYNFGLLQSEPAKAQVAQQGPASVTLKISNKELFGEGDEIGYGKNGAGKKGVADWYFRFYTGKPEFDSWIDYNIERSDTKWTRDLQVRYGLADWANAMSVSKPGLDYATSGQVTVVPLDEEFGRQNVLASFTTDGNVLQLMLGKPDLTGLYHTDKWRTMPAMPENDYAGALASVLIKQYSIESYSKAGTAKNDIVSVKKEQFSTILAQKPVKETPVLSPEGDINKDFSFEERGKYWSFEPDDSYLYYGDAHSGKTSVRLNAVLGGLSLMRTNAYSSFLMNLDPKTNYKVTFWAKAPLGQANLMINFFAGGSYDFKQIQVKIEQGNEWKKYETVVPTGAFPKGLEKGRIFASTGVVPCLRMWLLGGPQEVYIDDVEVRL